MATIAERFYEVIVNTIFGELNCNEWYTAHLDAIRGITTVILCGVVILFVIGLVYAVGRFFGAILSGRR